MLNGFTNKEIATRNEIADLIAAKKFSEAKELSVSFINSNKKRSLKRRSLLKQTVKFWITLMNGGLD